MLNCTGQCSGSIQAILQQLFRTCGKVTPQQVKAKDMELHDMHHGISQPIDAIFNCMDDLSDLADHAMSPSPMTDQQMVDLACVVLAKQPLLQPDLRLWNKRPAVERAHANFVQHLRDAHSDLSTLPAASDVCHQQPPHHANLVTIADLVTFSIAMFRSSPSSSTSISSSKTLCSMSMLASVWPFRRPQFTVSCLLSSRFCSASICFSKHF
jgi:hypothetical protein